METTPDYSYGVVPIRYTDKGTIEYLTIYQYSPVKGDHYWIFPKGHADEGETQLQAAIRELKEETGLEATIQEEPTFSMFYDFTVAGALIKKEVIFYIGEVTSGTTVELQEEEVCEARWGTYEIVRDLLTYDNARAVLDAVHQQLTAHPK